MFLLSVLRNALFLLFPLSLILSSYLYLYPVFSLDCSFPTPEQDSKTAYLDTLFQHIPFGPKPVNKIAPFRLLTLGDPQLEGDTSIANPEAANLPNLRKLWKDALLLDGTKHSPLQRVRHSLHDLVDFYLDDLPKTFEVYRKLLDHVGNDYYLGHIYRTLHWWAVPTHVTVLGDLVGSQWIDDEEFETRGWRYWNRVFKGGLKVPDEVASEPSADFNSTLKLGDDAAAWRKRIINVAGNHDIGYAGDLSRPRMERFTRVFGKPNYELRFQLPVKNASADPIAGTEDFIGMVERPVPELRIIVLNDMNLDTPVSSLELQDETYAFLNDVITTSKDVDRPAHFTLVLTHIPLYKEAGVCVDAPLFSYFEGEFSDGIKEQNHLSRDASKGFLEGIFGMSGNPNSSGQGFGRDGLILNGHDHEGCDTYHFINQTSPSEEEWQARRWKDAIAGKINQEPGLPGLREITVRSMMGGFAGNAGLLSLWFDEKTWDWRFEFSNCGLGTQHLWWFVHILNLITVGVGIVYGVLVGAQSLLVMVFPRSKSAQKAKESNGRANDITSGGSQSLLVGLGGKLEVPGAGNKSLRRKRSKMNLKASIANGSLTG